MGAELPEGDTRKPAAFRTGLRVIGEEGPWVFGALASISLVRAVVPALTALLAGRAVAAVPAAVNGDPKAANALVLALVAIAGAYAIDQVIESLVFPIEEGWSVTLYGAVQRRTMRALLDPPLLDHLLDEDVQQLADQAARQEWPNIAPFATAMLRATTWLAGAALQAVLIARFSVPLAVLTFGGWFAVGSWVRRRELDALLDGFERTRRSHYFRRFALDHKSAAEIRTFGLGPWLVGRFDDGWQAGMVETWRVRLGTGRLLIPLLGLVAGGNLAAISFLAWAAYQGRIAPPQVAVVATSLIGMTQLALPQHWTESLLRGATRLPALFAIEAVAAREIARVTPLHPIPVVGHPAREVRFEGVTFSYPGRNAPILKDLDLTIPAGTSVAIVGINGAGKTTLVKLLARLHDPTSGRITIDGVDLRDFDPAAWQARVAAIFQDFVRYPLTAGENVALLDERLPMDTVALALAADVAGAEGAVAELPHGWETILSRRYREGSDLSGGQWQRIALARAVYAIRGGQSGPLSGPGSAGVLVLDEPTANLDARGEAELFDRFLDVARGTTTVLISHRFSTVRRADHIVVLDEGSILEAGTHDELVARRGRYAELFALQADRYRSADEVAG